MASLMDARLLSLIKQSREMIQVTSDRDQVRRKGESNNVASAVFKWEQALLSSIVFSTTAKSQCPCRPLTE